MVAAGIGRVVVVVPQAVVAEVRDLIPEADAVVAGGATRQESVREGLKAIDADRVVVHDAARPFAPPALFGSVLSSLAHADAAVPGLQMKETVKIVRDHRVVQTLDREEVWNIQTPQGFRTSVLREAHERAVADGFSGTDDAQLVEHYGGSVVVVAGSALAFKITDADDVREAQRIALEGDR